MSTIDELLTRRVEKILPSREGLATLLKQRKIRLYLGIDPTGFRLHIGHGIVLRKLQEFIDAGHDVMFLAGSFTGKIGDPSDRDAERTPLSDEQIEENMKDYRTQAGKLVDFARTRFVYNGEWLGKLTFEDVVKLASHFTVQQMIEREMFQQRLRKNKPIHLHEFMYPLMQGYDSVHLDVDLELGGSDQLFNMMAGRTLLKTYKNKEKFVMTMPLLVGTNGQKMSKSVGNCVWLDDSPDDMFGKLMRVPDDQIVPYMEFATNTAMERVNEIKKKLEIGMNPMDAKKELATTVVTELHSASAAREARKRFEQTFQQGQTPSDIPSFDVSSLPPDATIIDLLVASKLIGSRGEGKRLIDQGGIELNEKRIQNSAFRIQNARGVIRVGKRNWRRLT